MATGGKASAGLLAAAGLALALAAAPASAGALAAASFDEKSALAYSQDAIGRQVGDYSLLDTAHRPVRLEDLRGKPLVISMIYTGCTQSCPLIVQALYRAIEAAQAGLGRDSFNVVSVSFDALHDTPERLAAYAASQGADLPHWAFLSGERATIERLSADVGFVFFPSSKGFDHLTQTTVLDGDGVVYRQIYGADFAPPTLVEPLKELLYGRRSDLASVRGLLNRVRLLCTIYDPATGRYTVSYAAFVGMGIGLATLVGFGWFVLHLWMHSRTAPGGRAR